MPEMHKLADLYEGEATCLHHDRRRHVLACRRKGPKESRHRSSEGESVTDVLFQYFGGFRKFALIFRCNLHVAAAASRHPCVFSGQCRAGAASLVMFVVRKQAIYGVFPPSRRFGCLIEAGNETRKPDY